MINTNYIKNITIFLLIITIGQKIYIYNDIHLVYEERLKYIQSEMQDKIETITIPYLPFNKYVQNDTSHFIGQYYYYEKPNDIEFKMIDYDEWINKIN